MASSSDGKLHLASMHLLAVVEIRPPGVQILLFLSTTKVTTELQTEGFFFPMFQNDLKEVWLLTMASG
jgi:hypothetical protein